MECFSIVMLVFRGVIVNYLDDSRVITLPNFLRGINVDANVACNFERFPRIKVHSLG